MEGLKQIKNQGFRVLCSGVISGQHKIIQIFNLQQVRTNNLEQSLQFNKYVLTSTNQKAFPQYFLPAQVQENQQSCILLQDYYEQTLDKYLPKIKDQKQTLTIFQQVLKSIYSLTFENLPHRNIRPEHFALVKGVWKLRSVVWSSQNYGIDNQYTLNAKYQSPEQYQNEQRTLQPDACQIIVWNLGSLLLDMLMRIHYLNSQKIINKFKNKPFSLKALGANKVISSQLSTYLSEILHYNPQKRTKLNNLYQNPYFSKDISNHCKQNKAKLEQVIKSVSRSSALKTELRGSVIGKSSVLGKSNQGSKMLIKSQILRDSSKELNNIAIVGQLQKTMVLLQIDSNLSRQQLLQSRKNGTDTKTIKKQDQSFDDLKIQTKIFLQPKRKSQITDIQFNKVDNDQEFKKIFCIYKTFIDRSQLLCVSVSKFSQIPYEDKYREEFILLNQFSVYYESLIQLHKIIQSINLNRNIYKISQMKFDQFINSTTFFAYRKQLNKLFMQKKTVFQTIAHKLLNLPQNKKNLMLKDRFIQYVQKRDIYNYTFLDIKMLFRQILKMTYDKISVLYNVSRQQYLCRLSLYTVYCMTIDKLYIESDLIDNFSYFLEWSTTKSTRRFEIDNKSYLTLSVSELQKYFDTAPIKILIEHSKKILRKYYKI